MDVRVIVTKTKVVETAYDVHNVESLDEAGKLALSCANGHPQGSVTKFQQKVLTPVNEISTYEVIVY